MKKTVFIADRGYESYKNFAHVIESGNYFLFRCKDINISGILFGLKHKLPATEFTMADIKKICSMRWGIETSFRELKYAVGLTRFHAKKREYILQEIWARLILYNFCEIITGHIVIENVQRNMYIRLTIHMQYIYVDIL